MLKNAVTDPKSPFIVGCSSARLESIVPSETRALDCGKWRD